MLFNNTLPLLLVLPLVAAPVTAPTSATHQPTVSHKPDDTQQAWPPLTMNAVVRLEAHREPDGKSLGWGAPIGADLILTVAHLVASANGNALDYYTASGEHGKAEPLPYKKGIDVAYLRVIAGTQVSTFRWLEISKDAPRLQQRVWWKGYLRGGEAETVLRGYYLGIDNDGDAVFDGFGSPGMSGSPILTDDGQIMAVVSSGDNYAMESFEPETSGDRAKLEPLHQLHLYMSSFRAVVCGTPVWGHKNLPGS